MKGENAVKSKEELNALKEKVETVSRKLHELTEEELAQVTGGGLATSRDASRLQNEQQGWSGLPAY